MSLTPGTRVGPYEIVSAIGAGGMGEVYRATDSNLKRSVALKVLPAAVAGDADRLARFQREAEVLAALNHPNIAAIYGFVESEPAGSKDPALQSDGAPGLQPRGFSALVMELVEGEDLSAIIANGARGLQTPGTLPGSKDPGLHLDDALAIARQIADALEAAHEQGIVHRDLKPANIKVRADGTVKVLDFGLAKALGPEGASATADAMNSPTLTARATQMGMILGTAAYMAPEQARGKAVDKRADIWAFGVVLYEMLSGTRAFEGDDVSITLANVMKDEVRWDALPKDVPAPIHALIRRCLEKDPKKRLRDIGDARHLLDDAAAGPAEGPDDSRRPPAAASRRTRPTMIALAAVTVLALVLAAWSLTARAPAAPLTYVSLALPEGHVLVGPPAISRDGHAVAFVSSDGNARPQLYVRRLDEAESHLISGSEDASEPFFAPDGRSVAFYGKNALFKVSLAGGAPVRLAESNSHNGGTWMDDGRIVFQHAWNGGLYTVPENGGPDTVLIEPKRPEEYAYVWPLAMPGSRELIFSRWGTTFSIQRLDLRTMTQTTVVAGGWRKSAHAASGFLVYGGSTDAGELWAVPYSGSAKGAASVTVAEHVDVGDMSGDARFDISETGTLAYSRVDQRRRSMVVVDVVGRATPTGTDERAYDALSLSPDGHRVATRFGGDLQVVDLDRHSVTPLAPELKNGAQDDPVWLDNKRLVFASNHEGNWEIYATDATGAGNIEPVLRRPLDQFPVSHAPDGALLFVENHPASGADIWILPRGGKPEPWLVTSAEEGSPHFSPDGRLVAYVSNASGRSEVYVQPREKGSGRVPVSVEGGDTPVWSPAGDRLYYRKNNAMMVASIMTRAGVAAGAPELLFDGGWALGAGTNFAVRPDGKSFLMIRKSPEAIPARIDLVLNWFGELARRAAK
jgi:eukaryotic-like serine/threonine-protein kinase